MTPGPLQARRSPGFTFLELVVVLVIMSVGMALAMPRLAPQKDSASLRAGQAVLSSMASLARWRASQTGRAHVLMVTMSPPLAAVVDSGSGAAVARKGLGEGVSIRFARLQGKPVEGKEFRVSFHPDGSAASAQISLEARGKNTRFLTIDAASGRVREG